MRSCAPRTSTWAADAGSIAGRDRQHFRRSPHRRAQDEPAESGADTVHHRRASRRLRRQRPSDACRREQRRRPSTLMLERLSPFRVAPKPNRAARRRAARGVLTCRRRSASWPRCAADGHAARSRCSIPLNYQENLLSAARALEQINNQVRQLQSQAQMLLRMDHNLLRLGSTISPDLQRTLAAIQSRLRTGDGIALKLQDNAKRLRAACSRDELSAALSTDDMLRNAKSRWEEEHAALQARRPPARPDRRRCRGRCAACSATSCPRSASYGAGAAGRHNGSARRAPAVAGGMLTAAAARLTGRAAGGASRRRPR